MGDHISDTRSTPYQTAAGGRHKGRTVVGHDDEVAPDKGDHDGYPECRDGQLAQLYVNDVRPPNFAIGTSRPISMRSMPQPPRRWPPEFRGQEPHVDEVPRRICVLRVRPHLPQGGPI